MYKFKKKLLSKESSIERIFLRDDEKTLSDPNININIGFYENEENINRKSNIHRARLSKFKKSKLNGEFIFIDHDQKIFKYVNGKKFKSQFQNVKSVIKCSLKPIKLELPFYELSRVPKDSKVY